MFLSKVFSTLSTTIHPHSSHQTPTLPPFSPMLLMYHPSSCSPFCTDLSFLSIFHQAFITFRTFQAATIARQVVHMQLAGHMAISEAPEPTDVTWINMYTTRTGQLYRRFLVEAIVLFLIVIWVRPIQTICHQ